MCVVASLVLIAPARAMRPLLSVDTSRESHHRRFRLRDFGFSLAGYALFGVGYIGYMTFVIALLREQGASANQIIFGR